MKWVLYFWSALSFFSATQYKLFDSYQEQMGCCSEQLFTSKLFTSDEKPTEILLKLLDTVNIPHNGTLESILQETQKKLLRPAGLERWELSQQFEERRDIILSLLEKLGCIQECQPSEKEYDYAVIMGATISRMRTRLAYLIKLWNQGIRFRSIIILTGERPLDPKIESKNVLVEMNHAVSIRENWQLPADLPTNEHEACEMIWDQAQLPDDLQKTKVVFISSPMKEKNGKQVRPTTNDTFDAWLEQNPTPGLCLIISNQPFVPQQTIVACTILPFSFNIEGAGPEVSNISMVVALDNLARWIYQEYQYRKKLRML